MPNIDELLRRQKALGDFGDFVLDHDDLQMVLDEGCRLVAEALNTDLAKVLQIEQESDCALVRAGVGWGPNIIGKARISLSERSSEAYAIAKGEPIITNDIAHETRFHFPAFLSEHGVIALVNVPIFLPGRRPWGVLQVDARERREFQQDDIEFLKTYSMVLGPVVDRLQNLSGLRDSEQRFHTLFNSIDEGVAISEMIYDERGEIVDMIFRQVNRAYERQGGIADVVGRSKFDILPNVEDHWLQAYKRVAKKGEPVRIEDYQQDVDRWLDVYFTRVDDEGRFVAIIFKDITERKHAEEALRASEERQAFLLQLSDALRPLTSARELKAAACALLGKKLCASRAYVVEMHDEEHNGFVQEDYTAEGVASLAGRYDFDSFPATYGQLRTGATWIVPDLKDETNLQQNEQAAIGSAGVIAWVDVPLLKAGHLEAVLCVTQTEPRNWTASEVSLVEETAERLWSAVLRGRAEAALRESERLRSAMLDVLPLGLGMLDREGIVLWSNPQWARFVPRTIPSRDAERGWRWRSWSKDGQLVQPSDFPTARALRGETVLPPMEFLYTEHDGRETWTSVASVPVTDGNGAIAGAVSIIQDIDVAKRALDLQRTLIAELQHRVRNILGMMRSVVRRSSLTKSDLTEFVQHLEGRIDAMARTQALLTRTPGKLIDLEDLARDEMLAQSAADGKFALYGPPVRLSPRAAEVLTLALHELATNSVKYGALSNKDGRITVNWEIEGNDQPRLHLVWHESGLERQSTGKTGFGTELITRRVPYELKGRGEMVFSDDSLTATIEFPLNEGSSILETNPVPWKGGSYERRPPA